MSAGWCSENLAMQSGTSQNKPNRAALHLIFFLLAAFTCSTVSKNALNVRYVQLSCKVFSVNSKSIQDNSLRLRGGSWNPVKWVEDAIESVMKQDTGDMLARPEAIDPEQSMAAIPDSGQSNKNES